MHYSDTPVPDARQCNTSCFLPTPVHFSSYLMAHKDQEIRQHETHEQHAFSHGGKDLETQHFVEKGMAEPSPRLILPGQMCPGLLEAPQQHHSQLHGHFKLVLLPEEAFPPPPPPPHPTPLPPLCWYKCYSCTGKWMGELTHIKETQQETNKRPVSIWLSFLAGCRVCKTTSLFPCTSTSERQDLFCQQHQLRTTEHAEFGPCKKLRRARALHKVAKENPNHSKRYREKEIKLVSAGHLPFISHCCPNQHLSNTY